MGIGRMRKSIAMTVIKLICPAFACYVAYLIIIMLRDGKSAFCRGSTAPEHCSFLAVENPQFYWITMMVWFLIFAQFHLCTCNQCHK